MVRSSSAAVVAALLLAACAKRDDVKAPILRIAEAVEKKDANAVADWLTRDYHDAEHENAQAVVARVRQLAGAYAHLKIDVSRMKVDDLGASRRARFRAELSGTPKNVPGLEGFLPRKSAWDFEASLVYEGGRWRIATASWKPAE
jgi:hypothetical protein